MGLLQPNQINGLLEPKKKEKKDTSKKASEFYFVYVWFKWSVFHDKKKLMFLQMESGTFGEAVEKWNALH